MLHKEKLIALCIAKESGQYGVPYSAEEYDASKYRYLRITDIADDGRLLDNDLKSVSGDNLENYLLSENDIVFARTGNSTGRAYLYDKRHGDLVYAGFLIRYKIDENKINPQYLRYFTNSNYYKQWVNNLSNGSTRGNINAQTFADCDIVYPDRSQQEILVNTLSCIDEKIALNTRMNAELEAMAKQLYDYWFVQFDFPDENGNPYKSSGGKMVYNSTLKREIPAGWEVKNIFEAVDVLYGYPFSTESFTEEETEKPVVRIRDILNNSTSAFTTEDVDELYKLQEGDVVIGMDGNFHMNYWHNNECYLNQRCVRLRDKIEYPISTIQIYYNIRPILDNKQKRIQGSTVGHLLDSDIKEFWILYPNQNNKEIKVMFDSILYKVTRNKKEIIRLTHLRDSLLPMLMNGQVTVE